MPRVNYEELQKKIVETLKENGDMTAYDLIISVAGSITKAYSVLLATLLLASEGTVEAYLDGNSVWIRLSEGEEGEE